MRAAAGLWIAAFASATIAAQTYPDRPVRFVVASGPGGSTDAVSRIVGDKLGEFWSQQIVRSEEHTSELQSHLNRMPSSA